ncbi:MAG: glutamate--tRNA ligase [bacterium]|nr:glutamate--tRNA ligase [bacterium]
MRFRFAPSPTGNLHIGSVRTALFNWVYAKHTGGTLILRIEDTDLQRSKPEFEVNILEGLKWLGLDADEGPENPGAVGPYRQSERIDNGTYQRCAEQLIESGHAYYCFATEAELTAEREAAEKAGKPYVYSGASLKLTKDEVAANIAAGLPKTIRLRVPVNRGEIVIQDQVRGEIRFDSALLGDFIIIKSDGSAAYNFAVVVDDIEMKVTHIVRGEDHISNTPRQVLVYEAFSADVPYFAHLPIILGPDKSKLSKRHGAQSVTEYKEAGFLPEAIINYLSLLGWTPADGVEFMDRDALVQKFDVTRISKSGAVFDHQKLVWMNGQYIRKMTHDAFVAAVTPFLSEDSRVLLSGYSHDSQKIVFEMVQESVALLPDINTALEVFSQDGSAFNARLSGLSFHADMADVLRLFLDKILVLTDWSESGIDALIESILTQTGLGKGKVLKPIRMATTGLGSGPHLPALISLLGQTIVGERVSHVLDSQLS